MYRKIIVIGSPGSGKSVFSRKLADLSGLPLYHLDLIYHRKDRSRLSVEEFDRRLQEILELDEWIIDGNYLRSMKTRLDRCEEIFFFDLPTEICIEGIRSRAGKQREDMPWIENEVDEDFIRFLDYVKSFREEKLPLVYELVASSDKKLTVFHSRKEADDYLERYGNRKENIGP